MTATASENYRNVFGGQSSASLSPRRAPIRVGALAPKAFVSLRQCICYTAAAAAAALTTGTRRSVAQSSNGPAVERVTVCGRR